MAKIQEELKKWAEKYVPIFNDLSAKTQTYYYTQSPIGNIDSEVDLMIIGINPKGAKSTGAVRKTAEEYLNGNPRWNSRFLPDNKYNKKEWGKYVDGVRFFMGYDDNFHPESIDNDNKTIWTNISPFQSENGFSDLPKEVIQDSINNLTDLISIVKPKRIVLLGVDTFKMLTKYANEDIKHNIEYVNVLKDWKLQIGRINGISTVCVNHPSGAWAISNKFISVFIFLYFLTDKLENRKPTITLEKVKSTMIDEMYLWQTRMNITK